VTHVLLELISVREGVFSVSVFDDFIVKQLIRCICTDCLFYTNCVLAITYRFYLYFLYDFIINIAEVADRDPPNIFWNPWKKCGSFLETTSSNLDK